MLVIALTLALSAVLSPGSVEQIVLFASGVTG